MYTPNFIRGTVQRTPFTAYGGTVYEWDIAIRTAHVTIHGLDTNPRLTDDLQFDPHRLYTCIIWPFLADDPQYHAPTHLPEGIGSYGDVLWWETPIWWGGIVRDLQWRFPGKTPTLATQPGLDKQRWIVAETPVGDILVGNTGDILKMDVGEALTWSRISWFHLGAILTD